MNKTKHHANRVARLQMLKESAESGACNLANDLLDFVENSLWILEEKRKTAEKGELNEQDFAFWSSIHIFKAQILKAMAKNGFYYHQTEKEKTK